MPRETLISATQYRQLRRLLYPGSESGTALSLLTLDNIITLGTYHVIACKQQTHFRSSQANHVMT